MHVTAALWYVNIVIGYIKGVSTHRRRGGGMQLSYILYRGRNAGGYYVMTSIMPYKDKASLHDLNLVIASIIRGGDIGGAGGAVAPPLLTGPNHRYYYCVWHIKFHKASVPGIQIPLLILPTLLHYIRGRGRGEEDLVMWLQSFAPPPPLFGSCLHP